MDEVSFSTSICHHGSEAEKGRVETERKLTNRKKGERIVYFRMVKFVIPRQKRVPIWQPSIENIIRSKQNTITLNYRKTHTTRLFLLKLH